MIKITIILLILLIIAEYFLSTLVNFLREFFDNSQNWIKNKYVTNIIIKKKDYFPKINNEELIKFKLYMADRELGTTYKKNTTVIEKYYKKKLLKPGIQ